ncbi:MAG: hypothetical protein ACQEQM_02625 [Thermoplasmatota archaeon]
MIYLVINQTIYSLLQLSAYACCGFIIFLAGLVAVFYFFSKYSESSTPYEDKKRVKTDEDDVGMYSSDDIGFEEEKTNGKDVSFFDKILGRKKVCDECGTELVYKKSYDSLYCPECRTFK